RTGPLGSRDSPSIRARPGLAESRTMLRASGSLHMSTQLSRVTEYFARTRLDYELFWTGNRDQALHHGYYDATTTSHSAALIRMNEVLAEYAAIRPQDRVLD